MNSKMAHLVPRRIRRVFRGWLEFLARQTRPPEHSRALRTAVACNVGVGLLSTGYALDWPWFVYIGFTTTLLAMALSYRWRTRNNWDVKAILSVGMVLAMLRFFWAFLNGNVTDPRIPLAELLVWLQTLHSFDLPGRRDLNYSLLVGLILISIAAVTSTQFGFGIFLAFYALAFFWASSLQYQRQVQERDPSPTMADIGLGSDKKAVRTTPSPSAAKSPPHRTPHRTPWLGLVLGSIAVFMLFPRFQGFKIRALPFALPGRLSMPNFSRGKVQNPSFPQASNPQEFRQKAKWNPESYAGLNQIVDLQLRGEMNHELVLRVRSSHPSYLRGVVFDKYDGQFWTKSEQTPKTITSESPPFYLESEFRPTLGRRPTACQPKTNPCDPSPSPTSSTTPTPSSSASPATPATPASPSGPATPSPSPTASTTATPITSATPKAAPCPPGPVRLTRINASSLVQENVQIIYAEKALPNVILAAFEPQTLYFPSVELYRETNAALISPYPMEAGMVYSVISREPREVPELLRTLPSDDARLEKMPRTYWELPPRYQEPGTPEYQLRQLALEITKHRDVPYLKVLALVHFLSSKYPYRLDTEPYPEGSDIAAYFVLVKKHGYCEQFATSLAVMARSVGLPSRYVTGFLPGTYNPFTGYHEVTNSEAHAWTEIYIPHYGWLPFDATPPGQQMQRQASRGPSNSMLDLLLDYLKTHKVPTPFWIGLGLVALAFTWPLLLASWKRRRRPFIQRVLELCPPKPDWLTLRQYAQQYPWPALHRLVDLHEAQIYAQQAKPDPREIEELLAQLARQRRGTSK